MPARRTVLVVDDEPMIPMMCRRVLEPQGWDVLAAGDGVAALELVESLSVAPDLVITDMRMPRMGGAKLVTLIHERYPTVPILCVSAYPMQEAPEFCDALAKPFTPDELLAKVDELLGRASRPDPGGA